MQIILTWSKPQSRQIAAFLREWLKEVVPGVEPWMSEEDLEKGKQWFDSLMGQLGVTSTCLICVTRENVDSPWIHFEAGAIAMKQGQGVVFPYLIGVEPGELAGGPLALFQCTRADRNDTWRLVRDINRSIAKSHDEHILEGHFKHSWPKLKKKLAAAGVPQDAGEENGSELSPQAVSKDKNGMVTMSDVVAQRDAARAHLDRLANALYDICSAGGAINGARRHLRECADAPVRDARVAKWNRELDSRCKKFLELFPVVEPLIPDADPWVRQVKELPPGAWATQLNADLAEVRSFVGLTGGHFGEDESARFIALLTELFEYQRFLRSLELSCLEPPAISAS